MSKLKAKFPKELMVDLARDDVPDGYEIVKDEFIESGRWDELRLPVFKHDGNFYASSYRRGLTENQDTEPYEYDSDSDGMIEVGQVFPVKTTVIVYK